MTYSLAQRLSGRFAAILLAASGLVSLASYALPKLPGTDGPAILATSALSLAAGFLCWAAPWHRWSRRALLLPALVALTLNGVANYLGGIGPYAYGLHSVLVFVWVGLTLPRGSSVALSPLLVLSYVVPLLLRGRGAAEISSVAVTVPISVIAGEAVAWVAARLREVELADGQRMARMAWLLEASLHLSRARDEASLAQQVARLASELLRADGALVLLRDEQRSLRSAGSHAWDHDALALEPDEHPALAQSMRGEDLLSPDGADCLALARALGVPALRALALTGPTSPIGVILVRFSGRVRSLGEFDRGLARAFALQVGLAFERLRATQALLDASLHDPLTGVGNRRKADATLRTLEPGDALVMLDLDHFKRVNDSLGHAAGDRLLKSLAAFLRTVLRDSDSVYRIGGEEFLLVLRSPGAAAENVMHRVFESWRRRKPAATLSAGLAVHAAGRDPEHTLASADRALYVAKRTGRDRFVLGSAGCDPTLASDAQETAAAG